jgi:hypothetical protein
MLSQREVIEVKKPVFPLLLYADPGKPYRQRLGQHLKRIDAGTSNVNGSSPYMAARAGGLSRLDAMARAAVAAGDGQWGSVMGPQQLQPVHSRPCPYRTRRSHYTPSRQTRNWASGLPASCSRYSSFRYAL